MTIKRYDCTDGGAQFCAGCYTMTEDSLGDYVSFWDYDRHLSRGMFVLMEMMQAYERRVRSDCTTPEQIAAKPWECMEYLRAAEYLRCIHSSNPPDVTGNCPLCGEPRADHAEVAPDGKPECRMNTKPVCRQCGGFLDTLGRCRVPAHNTVAGG